MSIRSENYKLTEIDLVEEPITPFPSGSPRAIIEPDKRSRLVFLTDPTGLAVERYKLLRHQLQGLSPSGGLLLITSPSPGDGKTLTSTNLAWSIADSKKQTCLVDLDLRSPGVGEAIGQELPGDGVVEVLDGKSTIQQAMHQVGTSSLYILGVREPKSSPAPHLAPSVLRPFFLKLRSMFDWVIIDMPPAIPMSDVAEVLPLVDGALMIVRSGQTKKSLIAPTLEVLGTHLWGVVLNDSIISGSAYYGDYGYGADRKRKKQS
jgi:capsular exopolysaccharide synthesis family protein